MEAAETFLVVGINDGVSDLGDAGEVVATDETAEQTKEGAGQTKEGAGDDTADTADEATESALVLEELQGLLLL